MTEMTTKEITAKEAAQLLGVSVPRVHQLDREGRLRSIWEGRDRKRRYDRAEVEKLVKDWHRITSPEEKLAVAMSRFRRSLKPLVDSGFRPAVEILEKIGILI